MSETDPLDGLKALFPADRWSVAPQRLAPKLVEWRDRWEGTTPLLLLPRSTAEVAAMVAWCAERGVAITPQGGNTGLVGGQTPRGEVLLSTERLNAVRSVSDLDDVLVIEAGATLAAAHEAALSVGRFFPLSLASEGSATIGGLVSTNAGGVAVLRYGTMRDLVLGIEAVLPNGAVFNNLTRLRKNNTGYDLKQLLIGAEGTLGVVTAAALKLFAALPSRAAALVGLSSAQKALALLAFAKSRAGSALEAFELMSAFGLALAERNIPGCRNPLAGAHQNFVLIELAAPRAGEAEAALESLLSEALESSLIEDASLAGSEAQRLSLWRLRESQSAAQKPEGVAWKHDIAVPVAEVARFIEQASLAVETLSPGARIMAFGHVGDGNIHFNVLQPEGQDGERHRTLREAGARAVHDIADALGGSISAEHGLGVMKTEAARLYKDPVDIAAMQAVRAALDPKRIMNPRVLF